MWLLSSPPQCKAQRDSIKIQMNRVLCHVLNHPHSLFLSVYTMRTKCTLRSHLNRTEILYQVLQEAFCQLSVSSSLTSPVPASWCTCHFVQAATMAGDTAITCWHFIWFICDAALLQSWSLLRPRFFLFPSKMSRKGCMCVRCCSYFNTQHQVSHSSAVSLIAWAMRVKCVLSRHISFLGSHTCHGRKELALML